MNQTIAVVPDLISPGVITMLVVGSVCSLYVMLICLAASLRRPDCLDCCVGLFSLTHFLAWPGTTVLGMAIELKEIATQRTDVAPASAATEP